MSRSLLNVTPTNAAVMGDFGWFRKTSMTRISLFTVPPGTSFKTPEGLQAEDEDCRIAFDVQGGVYPIRESVFQASYEAGVRERFRERLGEVQP